MRANPGLKHSGETINAVSTATTKAASNGKRAATSGFSYDPVHLS